MIIRMVNAIARTVPTVNTNLAGFDFGFGATCPSWLQYPWYQFRPRTVCRTFRRANQERCVSYFTFRIIIILMETIKNLYISVPTAIHPSLQAITLFWPRPVICPGRAPPVGVLRNLA